jgi:hypothetical protein
MNSLLNSFDENHHHFFEVFENNQNLLFWEEPKLIDFQFQNNFKV